MVKGTQRKVHGEKSKSQEGGTDKRREFVRGT